MLRIALLTEKKIPKWKAKVYDVEIAFFNGDLPEPICIKNPKGLQNFAENLTKK